MSMDPRLSLPSLERPGRPTSPGWADPELRQGAEAAAWLEGGVREQLDAYLEATVGVWVSKCGLRYVVRNYWWWWCGLGGSSWTRTWKQWWVCGLASVGSGMSCGTAGGGVVA